MVINIPSRSFYGYSFPFWVRSQLRETIGLLRVAVGHFVASDGRLGNEEWPGNYKEMTVDGGVPIKAS